MTRILVTGASGLLGANLVLHAADEGHRVIASSRLQPIAAEGFESALADLSLPGEARRMLQTFRPEWVVHCAALTDLDRCEGEPELAFKLNADMAEMVAHASRRVGARLLQISTDAVFDGHRGAYTEADKPAPRNVYGKAKLAGEQAVIQADPSALIVRTNFFGWNAQAKHGLAEWFLSELKEKHECPGFTDAWFSPILVNDLCSLMLRMLEAGFSGVYHVPGADCVSKYEFGVRLAREFGLDPTLVMQASVKGANLAAPRGEQLCLRAERLIGAFGEELPGLARGLTKFKNLWDSEYMERLRAVARSQSS